MRHGGLAPRDAIFAKTNRYLPPEGAPKGCLKRDLSAATDWKRSSKKSVLRRKLNPPSH
jgi:hypothetical protein